MNELEAWFRPLSLALGAGAGDPGLGPAPAEVGLLLDLGKTAAEAGPQRMYALLTAFAVGRALGRAERGSDAVDVVAFLQAARGHVEALAESRAAGAP